MFSTKRLALPLALAAFLCFGLPAQAEFLILAQDDDTITELTNGSLLTINSEGIGERVDTTIRIKFDGPANSTGRVEEPDLTGSLTFGVTTSAELPLVLQPGGVMDFRLRFTPTGIGPFTARLNLKLVQTNAGIADQPIDVLVILTGQAPDYTVSFEFPGGNETLLADGAVLPFPDTELDDSTTATMTITNRGTAPGSIETVAIDGGGVFELTGLALLPSAVSAGGELRFEVVFTPTSRANFGGSLAITFGAGSRNVVLSGRALGTLLTYEMILGSNVTPIQGGDTLVWEDITRSGEEGATTFRITNGGDVEVDITTITTTGGDFLLEGTPSLPLTLDPGQTTQFLVIFEPIEVGVSSGELRINDTIFLLSGTVNGIPAVTIGSGDQIVGPAEQPVVSVTLSEPYPVELNGVLEIDFLSDVFSNDPSIQFSTGGRRSEFTIPAHETQARFASGAQELRVQTGTVAGIIALSSSFETTLTSIDLTPISPPTTTLTILRARPEVRSLILTAATLTSISFEITGFATSRSVTDFEVRLTPAAGANLETTVLQADVANTFNAYYQGGSSTAFGSQFTATVNLNVDGDVEAVQSVSVNVENAEGTSETWTVDLQ